MFFFFDILIFLSKVITLFNRIKDYVMDKECKITITTDYIHVLNYKKIITFDDNNIILDVDNRILTIKGNDVVINKLLDNEMLIKGDIKNIEIR